MDITVEARIYFADVQITIQWSGLVQCNEGSCVNVEPEHGFGAGAVGNKGQHCVTNHHGN